MDPITAWVEVVQGAASNTGGVATEWLQNPFPLLRQALENVFGYGVTTFNAVGGAIEGAINYLSFSNEQGLWQTLGTAVEQMFQGEISAGFNNLINAFFVNPLVTIGLPIFTSGLLDIPVKITQNVANAVKAALSLENLLGLTLSALGPLGGILAATGDSLQATFDSLKEGNLIDAVFALINIPAAITGAVLNGYRNSDDVFLPGLLSFDPEDASQNGLVYTLLVTLPRSLAAAIAPESAPEAQGGPSATSVGEGAMVTVSERRASPASDDDAEAVSDDVTDSAPDAPVAEPTASAPEVTEPVTEVPAEPAEPVTDPVEDDPTMDAATTDTDAVEDIDEQLAVETAAEDVAEEDPEVAPESPGAASTADSSSDSGTSERRAARAA
ncbi:hypothetical protein ACAG25_20595 [Mycobacterium sp. pV006]|uniref:hypothetical protein n=1 Tax=Mycobacterium sp. pV006 TaxID=3238983 RepID=UPI00351BA645